MKKIKQLLLILILLTWSFNISFWNLEDKLDIEPSRKVIFEFISKYVISTIPESYNYIDLYYLDINKKNKSYKDIQKIVYTWVLPNKKINLNLSKKLNAYQFFYIISYITWYDFINDSNTDLLKNRFVKLSDIIMVKEVLESWSDDEYTIDESMSYYIDLLKTSQEKEKLKMLLDVYDTLIEEHYDKDKLDKDKLLYWWIEWLTQGSEDLYSVFFPPTESKNFNESLIWEFEWIWAYVEMSKPWILTIITPIASSPAEKGWLKWWDIIIKVDDFEIKKDTSIIDAVAKIKWPAWTKVSLTISRNWEDIKLEITREKVIIKDVESKALNNSFYYIQIKNFWEKVYSEFDSAVDEFIKSWNKKLIIDLRNNPGWYLDQVTNMLSMFVPNWEKTAIIKYRDFDYSYNSTWINKLNLNDYKIYILINWWTASASEIMVWTLKDYFPQIVVVWEKSFGKWSVQTLRQYNDWSSLKYTIAKWFTWKNQIWIDKVWISPDEEVILNDDDFKKSIDNQLNYILNK